MPELKGAEVKWYCNDIILQWHYSIQNTVHFNNKCIIVLFDFSAYVIKCPLCCLLECVTLPEIMYLMLHVGKNIASCEAPICF